MIGSYAYVAGGHNGLKIIDVTDPTNPVLVATYITPDFAYDVYVVGDYAYVADESSVQIVNVEDPSNPTLAGYYEMDVRRIYVADNYAFLGNGTQGLYILDIEDPANPILIEEYDSPGWVCDVFMVGNYIYLADESSLIILRFDHQSDIEERGVIPLQFTISQNYPNPFNQSTTISYSMPESSKLSLAIYNLLGQRAATIFESYQQAGEHSLVWNASSFPSGVYFAQLEAGDHSKSIKMVLLR